MMMKRMTGVALTVAIGAMVSLAISGEPNAQTNCVTIARTAEKPAGVADTVVSSKVRKPQGDRVSLATARSRQSLLRFDLSSLPEGVAITSATLSLTYKDKDRKSAGSGTVTLHRITAPWDAATATSATFGGAFDATPAGTLPVPHAPRWAVTTADVGVLVQGWYGGRNDGVLLAEDTVRGTVYRSSDAKSGRPSLEVCYAPATACDPNPCFAGVACTDVENGFTCGPCPTGYSGDGITCVDTDGCTSTPCFSGVACTDQPAPATGFTCGACPTGYVGDGVTCADADGCTPNPCFSGVACTDQPAPATGFTCGACPSGYSGDGVTCTLMDSCEPNPCFAGVQCTDTMGSGVSCGACPTGYQGDGFVCADIDECTPNPCFAGVTCTDQPAPQTGFTCGACPTGYQGDGITCTDIDDCAPNPCYPGVTCTDLPAPQSGFICGPCPAGSVGDGIFCLEA